MLASSPPEFFFGRRSEVETILMGVCAEKPRSFVIHGRRTMGKTALLQYLCHPEGAPREYQSLLGKFGSPGSNRLEFIYIDFYQVNGEDAIIFLFANLLRNKRLSEASEIPYNVGTPPSKPEAKKAVEEICQWFFDQDTRLVICIDHFDRAYRSLSLEDDSYLRSLIKLQAFIYATDKSLPELRASAPNVSPLYNILMPRVIGLLNEKEAAEIMSAPGLASQQKQGAAMEPAIIQTLQPAFNQDDNQFLRMITGLHPYLLVVACEHLFQIYTDTPALQGLLKPNKPMREQITREILILPAVQEILAFYWGELNPELQRILSEIAEARSDTNFDPGLINLLARKGLVKIDWTAGGQPSIFSELFRIYILENKAATRKELKPNTLDLPPIDQKLLQYFQARPNQTCSFEELLSNVWGDPETTKGSLDAAVHRLRRKLKDTSGKDWIFIENVRGEGFKYMPPD